MQQEAGMSFANPIIQAGVAGLFALYAERAVTPVEACDSYLSRIKGLDGAICAYVHVDEAGARRAAHASAARWAKGAARSQLDGTPVAVSANIAVKNQPWHGGVGAYRERRAKADAACVARLREAGAVLLGVLNMQEGGLGGVTDNAWFGRTQNPWKHGQTAGGSAGGGGAAVSAGFCAAALGAGSIGCVNVPASYTGVFGHRPTDGLIPAGGVMPVSWTLDQVGVLARSANDCAGVMAGSSGAELELAEELARPAPLAALREAPVAVLRFDDVDVEPAVAEAFEDVVKGARRARLKLERVSLDGYDFARLRRLALLIAEAEAAVEHEAALAGKADGFSPAFRTALQWGGGQPAAKLASAYRELAQTAEAVRAALSPYGALLMPATPQSAFPFDSAAPVSEADFALVPEILRLPATAFPTGEDDTGLPLAALALAWEDDVSLGLADLLAEEIGAPPSLRG
jgi:aspartyl-tRNA(Asn)/glutamyl-tRNA(Gln) amidotransferase subunit A